MNIVSAKNVEVLLSEWAYSIPEIRSLGHLTEQAYFNYARKHLDLRHDLECRRTSATLFQLVCKLLTT